MWRFSRFNKLAFAIALFLCASPLAQAQAQSVCGLVATIIKTLCSIQGGGGTAPVFSGPGDIVSGAIGWWGLRGYSAAYAAPGTNPAATVCDKATGLTCTTVNILTTGAFDVATAQAAPACAATCIVTKLFDQTGGGNHLVAQSPVTTTAPTLTFNCIGSLPCMTYNGTANYLQAASYTQAQPYSVSAVSNSTANQAGILFGSDHSGGNGTYVYYDFQNPNLVNNGYSNGVLQTNITTLNTIHASQAIFTTTTCTLYTDGVSGTSTPGTTAALINTDTIDMGSQSNNGGSKFLQGTIEEMGAWPAGFTNAQALALDTNERTYW